MASPKLDVVIYGSAIRRNRWMDLCNRLSSTNKCTFKIVFCGHFQPTNPMPNELVYIYADMKASACAEIAYRHALTQESKYVFNFQDDLVPEDGMLDELIRIIESSKSKLVVGPAFKPSLNRTPINLDIESSTGSGRILLMGSDRGLGLNYLFMKRALAQKVGGIDKRWEGGCPGWVEDLTLRLEELGGVTFRVCEKSVVAEDDRIQHGKGLPQNRRLTLRTGEKDKQTLKMLWNASSWDVIPRKAKRVDELECYKDEELQFHMCSHECKDPVHEKKMKSNPPRPRIRR